MFINDEKELEDYICKNMDKFILFLQKTFSLKDGIEFIGRQIIIGDSRIDLLFQVINKNKEIVGPENFRTFIVVELKNRYAEPKDFAQLSRYMNLLYDLSYNEKTGDEEVFVKGLLLTKGLNYDMQEIQMYLNNYTNTDIVFASVETNIDYAIDDYSTKKEYLEKMTIDDRLKLKEVNKNGKEENG